MATEAQTSFNGTMTLGAISLSENIRVCQKYDDDGGRLLTAFSFRAQRVGSPNGSIYLKVWTNVVNAGTDTAEAGSETVMTMAAVSTTATVYTHTLATPVVLSNNYAIGLYTDSTTGGSNYVLISVQTSNIKANEAFYHWDSTGSWEIETFDMYYSYEYNGGSSSPTVTTQAASAITATTATGNGNVTALGSPAATQYGHVWKTSTINTSLDYNQQANFTENGVPSGTGAYTSSLTGLVTNTTYYCRAYVKNSVGTSYGAEVTFTASSGVASVTTNQPISVVVTTAVGYGEINSTGGNAITAYGVCWSTSANPTTADSKTDEGAGSVGVFYTGMTGLTAGTLYHVRAYATNSAGTSYGSDLTFTTLAIGTPIVTTQACSDDAGTTAVGNGTITDIGAAAVTEHGHCWNTSVNPTTSNSKTTNGSGVAGAFTSQMTGLTAGTTYYVRAYATNVYGTAYGDNITLDRATAQEGRRILAIGKNLKIYFTDDDGNMGMIQGTAI